MLERALSEEQRAGAEHELVRRGGGPAGRGQGAPSHGRRERWTLGGGSPTRSVGRADRARGAACRAGARGASPAGRGIDLGPVRARDMWCVPHVDDEDVCAHMKVCCSRNCVRNGLNCLQTALESVRREHHGADRRGCAPSQWGPGPGRRERCGCRVWPRNSTADILSSPSIFGVGERYGADDVKVTDRRAAIDYANCIRELVDVHYPGATCIRVVQDICRSTSLGHCIRPSRRPRPDVSCAASNSTSPRSTQAGSTSWSARSACFSASVSAAASTTGKGSRTSRRMAAAAK